MTNTVQAVGNSFLVFHGGVSDKDREPMRTNIDRVFEGTGRVQRCFDLSPYFSDAGKPSLLTEGFSNDFAQWVLASANRDELAERLAALDIRDYLSIAELRTDLRRVMSAYCTQYPNYAAQEALEPFYFCEGVEVTEPLGLTAHNLLEFRDGLTSSATHRFTFILFLHACDSICGRMIFRCGWRIALDWKRLLIR